MPITSSPSQKPLRTVAPAANLKLLAAQREVARLAAELRVVQEVDDAEIERLLATIRGSLHFLCCGLLALAISFCFTIIRSWISGTFVETVV